MIRIDSVRIEEFRGIRKLELNLDGKNFGICGPNGTGKSGVVDAIEFCITGDVTRLSGQGSADLSVKAHAPHVDQQDHPERANVTISGHIPASGKKISIRRSVKYPGNVEISPDDADVKEVVEELQLHPEFALSRREIIKYIITPPGKRSDDVQTLLRLDHIEKQRKTLTTYSNSQKNSALAATNEYRGAEADLNTAFGIDQFESGAVLAKVNEKREILGLELLTELTAETSLKSGIPSPQGGQKREPFRKATALSDLKSLQDSIQSEKPNEVVEYIAAAKTTLEGLKADEMALATARRHGFIKTGLELVDENACPLCDTIWNAEELRGHLRNKILTAEEIEQQLGQLGDSVNGILQPLSDRIKLIKRVIQYCEDIEPSVEHKSLSTHTESLEALETTITAFMTDPKDVESAIDAVSKDWWKPDIAPQVCIDACQTAVNALPDSSVADQAREFIIVGQERYERLLATNKKTTEQMEESDVAKKVLSHYLTASTKVLEKVYDDVAQTFTEYYRAINREDEKDFVGKLVPAPAKLGFDVDFYGRGLFPPGAYHSEGHQDGMGLCLYLALMKHTLGADFTFAVLDDVLMSVDTGHRREVCRLLKKEFPNTQFILTTHDRVWLNYMRTEKLIHLSKMFVGWTIDSGPRAWEDQDVWTEIQEELDKNRVSNAAAILRRYLEYVSNILADNLRAKVDFQGDGRYELNDLFPPAMKAWKKWLLDGEESAKGWGRAEEAKTLTAKRAQTKDLLTKSREEQWAINPVVHFNEWANLEAKEFKGAVDAFKNLVESLRCENSNCKSFLYVLPSKGPPEELKCNCGQTTINLKPAK